MNFVKSCLHNSNKDEIKFKKTLFQVFYYNTNRNVLCRHLANALEIFAWTTLKTRRRIAVWFFDDQLTITE